MDNNKIKINNQVILMRKNVKQAKVHVINKLTKEVFLLKNRKGSEAQVLKAKRKADRYLEEVFILKKMKPDYVSRQALSKTKCWKEVLSDKSSTLEDRCLAVLANYKAVQKEVHKFHSSNPNLISDIAELVKEWEENSKLPKMPDFKKLKLDKNSVNFSYSKEIRLRNENNLNSVEKDSIPPKKQLEKGNVLNENDMKMDVIKVSPNKKSKKKKGNDSSLSAENKSCSINSIKKIDSFDDADSDENVENGNEIGKMVDDADSETEENCSEVEDSETNDDENLENTECSSQKLEIDNSFNNANESISQTNEGKNVTESKNCDENDDDDNDLNVTSNNVSENITQTLKASVENNLKTIAVLNLDELEGLDEIPISKEMDDEESEEENGNQGSSGKASDPFFLRPEEFESIAENRQFDQPRQRKFIFAPNQSVEQKMNRFERRNGRPKPKKRHLQDSENDDHFQKIEFSKLNGKKDFKEKSFMKKDFKEKRFSIKQDFKEKRFPVKNNSKFQTGGKKDFHSSNQKGFQKRGKTFSSDFKKQSNIVPFKKESSNSFLKNSKRNNITDKPLHPSWEAKRKQKELAQSSFQGKRMVFDD